MTRTRDRGRKRGSAEKGKTSLSVVAPVGEPTAAAASNQPDPAGAAGAPLISAPSLPLDELVVGPFTPPPDAERVAELVAAYRDRAVSLGFTLVANEDGQWRVVGHVDNYYAAVELGLDSVPVSPAMHVDRLRPCPLNPPERSKPERGLVASIARSRGVLQAVSIYIDPETQAPTISLGHRRCASSREAGYPYVPVMLDNRPIPDIIQDILDENAGRLRHGLAPAEEGALFERLMFDGLTDEQVARANGRNVKEVHGLVALQRLKPAALKTIGPGRGQTTLEDALRVAAVADPKVRETLEKKLTRREPVPSHVVEDAVRRAKVRQAKDAARRELRKGGARVLTENELDKCDGMEVAEEQPKHRRWWETLRPVVEMSPKQHAKLPCHAYFFCNGTRDGAEKPVPACLDPRAHGVTPPTALQREEARRRQEHEARTKSALEALDRTRADALPRLLNVKAGAALDILLDNSISHVVGRGLVLEPVLTVLGIRLRKGDDASKRITTAAKRLSQDRKIGLLALLNALEWHAGIWGAKGYKHAVAGRLYALLKLGGYEAAPVEAHLLESGELDLALLPEEAEIPDDDAEEEDDAPTADAVADPDVFVDADAHADVAGAAGDNSPTVANDGNADNADAEDDADTAPVAADDGDDPAEVSAPGDAVEKTVA